MATNRTSISSKFENLDVPNQDDFQEIIQSFVHKDEDKATFAMVEAGTNNTHYVTPDLLRTGLQNMGIITGNCYMPYKEYFEDLNGDTFRMLQKLPLKDSAAIFKNGQLLREDIDYTLNYNTALLTFSAPVTDKNIEVNYWYKNFDSMPDGGGTDLTQIRPYKVYTAILTADNDDNVVATVLENTLGGTVVWSHYDSSNFTATLVGAFTLNKTFVQLTTFHDESENVITVNSKSLDSIGFFTEMPLNYDDSYVEIRVYDTPAGGGTPLRPFNYLVVRYKWTPESGQDLDTFTGVVNTGTVLDNKWLGYGQTYALGYPNNSIGSAYLISGGDNTGSGVESCFVDFDKITTDFPELDIIQIRMAGNWYHSRGNGMIEIEVETYMDGTMSEVGYDFVNTGSPVQHLSFTKNIEVVGHLADNIESVTNIGYITYNRNSLTGQVTITN